MFLEESKNIEFNINKASVKDLQDVCDLLNDDLVRKNSRNPAPFVFKRCSKWFLDKIKEEKCFFYVIRNKNNRFIGHVRFDKKDYIKDKNVYEITIHLSEKFRNKGLGKFLVAEMSKKLIHKKEIDQIYAYVQEKNIISLNCFLKVGYKIFSKKVINNVSWFGLSFKKL